MNRDARASRLPLQPYGCIGLASHAAHAILRDIPEGLLDKADWVVVYPSVLKAAFVAGGSGREAMTCPKGEKFRGSWRLQR
jgi:lipid-binding SYLF domain-containing protein